MRLKDKRGFTLIETLIYIAIIGAIAVSFVAFGSSVSVARNKTYAAQEVQSNVRFVVDTVSNLVRSANQVTVASSVWNDNNGKLVLTNSAPNKNPTVLDVDENGKLRLKFGNNPPIFLTSERVKVDRFYLENLTGDSERENARISFSLVYRQESSSADFGFRQDVVFGVSVRQ